MQAAIGANLAVQGAGAHLRALRAMATFERRGQGPKAERIVPFYAVNPRQDTIWLPRGIWPQVHNLTGVQIQDRRLHFEHADYGWRGQLRPDQAELQRQVLQRQGGVVVCPTGWGKTPLGLSLIAQWGQPTLILVNREQIALQWVRAIKRFLTVDRRWIGQVGEGKEYVGGERIVVAMVQSLHKNQRTVDKLVGRMGAVVVDEGDGVPAQSVANIVTQFPGIYRASLTATPRRTDGLEGLMYALMGPGYTEMPYEEAFRMGVILRPKVHLVASPLRVDEPLEWAALQRARAEDPDRNLLLCQIAAHLHRQGRKVLMPLDLKAHGVRVAEMLRGYGVPAYSVDGEDPMRYRDRIAREMGQGRCVMIATSLADRGLDVPTCDAEILAAPGRSEPRVIQQAGRVVRTAPGKVDAHIYDVCDVHAPVLRKQIQSRLHAYRAYGFDVVRR